MEKHLFLSLSNLFTIPYIMYIQEQPFYCITYKCILHSFGSVHKLCVEGCPFLLMNTHKYCEPIPYMLQYNIKTPPYDCFKSTADDITCSTPI